MEDPGLARRFEAATRTGTLCRLRTGLARAATSLPVIIILLLLLVGSMALGMTIALYGLIPLTTIIIWLWLRRGCES